MSFDRSPTPITRPNRSFVLWCWAMLLVVLMSAAPTSTQVRTRLVGSAFDPASISVARSPKPTKAKAATSVRGSGLPDELQGDPPLVARVGVELDPALLAAPLRGASKPVPAAASLAYSSHSPRAHGARAPPIA